MKHVCVWFAVLSSVALTACVADAGDDEPGDEAATEVASQAVSTFNHLVNKQWAQCVDAPGGALNVTLKLASCFSVTELGWASVPVSGNVFTLVNQRSGLCMEVNNNTATPGERVDEFTCNGLSSEQWVRTDIVIGGLSYAQFRHNGTNLCLDTVGSQNSNLMQWTCDPIGNNAAQLWRVQ